jgi:hypothetical protein
VIKTVIVLVRYALISFFSLFPFCETTSTQRPVQSCTLKYRRKSPRQIGLQILDIFKPICNRITVPSQFHSVALRYFSGRLGQARLSKPPQL